jgi:tetratricopeptide (TPR) repeat protein
MAALLQDNGHDQEAAAYFKKSLALADSLPAEFAQQTKFRQTEVRRMVGWLTVKAGDAALDQGEWEQANHFYQQAIDLLAPVIRDPAEWYWYRLFVAQAHRGLGLIARERRGESAEREFAEAERIARAVARELPDPDPRDSLAISLARHWSDLADEAGRAQQADAALDEAVGLLARICDEFPATTWYRCDRAEALLLRARRDAAAGRDDRAEQDLTEARQLLSNLMVKEPDKWCYPGHLGRVEEALGQLRLRQRCTAEARRLHEEALGHLQKACQYRPRHVRDRRSLDEALLRGRRATDKTARAVP